MKTRPEEIWGLGGSGSQEWVSGVGRDPQNPRTWESMWPSGAEAEDRGA